MNYSAPEFQPAGDGYNNAPHPIGYSQYHPGMVTDPGVMAPIPGTGQQLEGDFKYANSVMMNEQSGVSAVKFDGVEELIWVGTNAGFVSSYHGASLQRYNAFRVSTHFPVRQLVTTQQGVVVLTDNNLRIQSRFGQILAEYRDPGDFHDMHALCQTSRQSLLVGGNQNIVHDIDIATFKLVNKYPVELANAVIIKETNRHLILADATGQLQIRDARSNQFCQNFKAHDAMCDFDVHDHQLVTCGWAKTRGGMEQHDRMLKVYDLRMMRSSLPLSMRIDPYFLKFIPAYSSSQLLVMSAVGHYQIIDTNQQTPGFEVFSLSNMLSHESMIYSMDVSSTFKNLVMGDAYGSVGLYTSDSANGPSGYNQYSRETQFAHVQERLPYMDINNDQAVYSSIPMYYPPDATPLLSEWPAGMMECGYNRPVPIDPQILNNVKMQGNIGYAKLPEGMTQWHPYQAGPPPTHHYGQKSHVAGAHGGRQVKSHGGKPTAAGGKGNVPPSPIGRLDDPFQIVPKLYRRVEIKYSKIGLTDFDFRHYNKTHFAGLETHIPNAYCNSMIQVLYFLAPLRSTLLNHLCAEEFCLACELGILFHMLDISKGATCQASNFLRAFRTIPEADALKLIFGDENEASKKNLTRIIQNWTRFVLQQLHSELSRPKSDPTVPQKIDCPKQLGKGKDKEKEGKGKGKNKKGKETPMPEKQEIAAASPPEVPANTEPTIIQKLFGTNSTMTMICKCGEELKKENETFMFDLVYPEAPVDVPNFQFEKMDFSQIVGDTLNSSPPIQNWCAKCSKYQPHSQSRVLKELPDVIGLNCQLENDTTLDFWKRQLELLATSQAQNPTGVASQANRKACRYGIACTRSDCYFYHEGRDDQPSQPTNKVVPVWVPLGFTASLDANGKAVVSPVNDPSAQKKDPSLVHYELLASIAHIREPKAGGNLVAHINVGEVYHQRKEGVTTTQHYLFNDFSIADIDKEEAVQFNMEWKWPCAIFYVKSKLKYSIDESSPFTQCGPLFTDNALRSGRFSNTTIPLEPEESLSGTSVVGIDAEFVSLNQEDAVLRSDGTKSTIKPPQMSLARVTCIRGKCESFDPELHLKPFMDDYITTQEEVVDYLTQFSGIKPGDLDKHSSSKHLTTLKVMYMRLRHMVDQGAVFVGHGLKSDFRVINIVIPGKQVKDTVELFHMPKQRLLSLKFLSWYFLGRTIQSANHDSTEDAQTAVRLYEKYCELENKLGRNGVKKLMMDVYEAGRLVEFRVPESPPPGPGIDLTHDKLKEVNAQGKKTADSE